MTSPGLTTFSRSVSNRANIMNIAGTFLWAGGVIAVLYFLPVFWEPEGWIDLQVAIVAIVLFLYLFAMGAAWYKIGDKKKSDGSRKLAKICAVLIGIVALGMVVYQIAYDHNANKVHETNGLKKLTLDEVLMVTYPGDRFLVETTIKTPSINGILSVTGNRGAFIQDYVSPWPSDVRLTVTVLSYASQTAKPTGTTGETTYEWDSLNMYTLSASKDKKLKVEMVIPENDISAEVWVKGHISVTGTYPVPYKSNMFDVVRDSQVESQDISFWVFPRNLASEIIRERDMAKREGALLVTIILAVSGLMPLIFLGISVEPKHAEV